MTAEPPRPHAIPRPATGAELDAALICDDRDTAFQAEALARVKGGRALCIVSDTHDFLSVAEPAVRLLFQALRLDAVPPDPDVIASALMDALAALSDPPLVCIDMGWAVGTIQGTRRIEVWGMLAERLSDTGLAVVSCYAKDQLIEDQMQAAFRAHRQFIAPSGLYDNPFWLPARLLTGAGQDQQIAFLLGRVVPDFAGVRFFDPADRMLARGASPDWLPVQPHVAPARSASDRWDIHCFGQLRVYHSGRVRVDWHSPGSSPNKTRTLFAYLLTSGEKGAHVDRIGELLWPEGGSEDIKRARLHHTVAMLRKALGDKGAVIRSGEYYRLNAPPGSWMDITSFEQLCRRGLSLAMSGRPEEALKLYDAADRLYQGDLFEDLPLEYVQSEQDDWCIPKRTWLRAMATKVHRDASVILRGLGRLREAQDHCQKALKLDPLSEEAHSETMRVFHAQGRLDAMARQYRQYQAAVTAMGDSTDFSEIKSLYRALTSGR